MAVYNTYSTNATNTQKEDVLDVITRLEPYKRPLFDGLGRGRKPKSTYHEWTHDAYATPAANAAVDGASATAATLSGQDRYGNYTQILTKCFEISGTMDAVQQYGKPSEAAYRKLKAARELVNDIEFALITGTSASGAADAARYLRGVLSWITTNVTTYTGAAVLTAAETALEKVYNDMLQDVFESGGEPKWAIMSGLTKRRTSNFTGFTNTKNLEAQSKKVYATVTVYKSDFGEQVMFADNVWAVAAPDTMAILEPSRWKIAQLRKTRTEKLAKTGDSTKWQLVTELTLEALAEEANAKITGLATTG